MRNKRVHNKKVEESHASIINSKYPLLKLQKLNVASDTRFVYSSLWSSQKSRNGTENGEAIPDYIKEEVQDCNTKVSFSLDRSKNVNLDLKKFKIEDVEDEESLWFSVKEEPLELLDEELDMNDGDDDHPKNKVCTSVSTEPSLSSNKNSICNINPQQVIGSELDFPMPRRKTRRRKLESKACKVCVGPSFSERDKIEKKKRCKSSKLKTLSELNDLDTNFNIPKSQKPVNDRIRTQKTFYECEKCTFKSITKQNLIRHIRIHYASEHFKCSDCSFSSAHKYSFQLHTKSHTGEKPLECSFCSYTSHDKRGMKRHVQTHTGEKPYKCQKCSYSTNFKHSLNSHIRVHTGEKPFKCSVCSYSSSDRSNIKRHTKTHIGEKPFVCSLCLYKFAERGKLKRHMKCHTEKKHFVCPLCLYSTTLKGGLKKHMKEHS